jgi:hypothetical protein
MCSMWWAGMAPGTYSRHELPPIGRTPQGAARTGMVSRKCSVIVMLVILVPFIVWLRALSLGRCSRSEQTRRR